MAWAIRSALQERVRHPKYYADTYLTSNVSVTSAIVGRLASDSSQLLT